MNIDAVFSTVLPHARRKTTSNTERNTNVPTYHTRWRSSRCFQRETLGLVHNENGYRYPERKKGRIDNCYSLRNSNNRLVYMLIPFRTVLWFGVVWCGVVWCGVGLVYVVWCGVVWCGLGVRSVVWCGVGLVFGQTGT